MMTNKIVISILFAFNILTLWKSDSIAQYDHEHHRRVDCSGTAIKFDYPPADLKKILFIEPMGSMHSEHVTPIDHQYYKALDHWKYPNAEIIVDVYSPADGVVTEIQHMGSFQGDSDLPPMDDYRVVIQHTCTISSYFIHIDHLSKEVAQGAPVFGRSAMTNVPVKAGEVIGTFRGSLDYNVVDTEVHLTGFIVPENYASEPWKIHVEDPFNYFNQPIRRRLISKSLRTAKPEGGKIDYDVDGKLVGNWFEENTNGYAGRNRHRYWAGHLAIAYDSIDSNHIVVSIGTYKGRAQQFGVKGNSPDPVRVSTKTGIVKYSLVHYDYFDNDRHWNRDSLIKGLQGKNDERVNGVALFQMIEQRKLKAEFFPGKQASQVNGFTDAALIFER